MPDLDPEKIASLAQKLYESLKALKPSKNKTNVSIPLSEFENILSRSQQVAVLTLASHRWRDALSLKLSNLLEKLAHLKSELAIACGLGASGVEPIPNPPPTPPTIPGGTRHGSLYLADGNLVVAASSGGGTMMLFRVHQSMLALQSPVFAGMFTLPPPDANQDVYDGAPFVHMPDDAKDIESLLKVLYNPS
jgi:predicted transcriptional regulator